MSTASAYVCGGRMQLLFRSIAFVENGEAVAQLVPYRALWDGQPVSDVVAEALAITWYEAQDADDEDDLEDDNAP